MVALQAAITVASSTIRKNKEYAQAVRFEQHDEKNSGDREQLYKRCGMLRYKAQTASYMMLDFLNTGKQVFGVVTGETARQKACSRTY